MKKPSDYSNYDEFYNSFADSAFDFPEGEMGEQRKLLMKMPFAAPASLARLLESLDLQEEDSVHVLIIGSEALDCASGGAFYQFVPIMLGLPFLNLHIELIGPLVDTTEFQNELGSNVTVSIFDGTLGEYADKIGESELIDFDLYVLFNPGFESHHEEFMSDDRPVFEKIVTTGNPVYFTSYSENEDARNQKFLFAYGFESDSPILNNVYFDMVTDNPRMPEDLEIPMTVNWSEQINRIIAVTGKGVNRELIEEAEAETELDMLFGRN